jgi:uncharacterized membrane protein YeaQ/YmgE (transglycosylase-associated protein family)
MVYLKDNSLKEHVKMDAQGLIIFLAVGAIAGWLAGILMKGGGFGLIGNILVGIVGAFVGGFVFSFLGLSVAGGVVGSIITATVGAVVLLAIVRVLKLG